MIKNWFKSFISTLGKIAAFVVMIAMSIGGVIFFLNRNDKYRNKKKQLKIYVENPNKKNDKEKGDQLEKDIDDLLSE